jgi:hypothetical protein
MRKDCAVLLAAAGVAACLAAQTSGQAHGGGARPPQSIAGGRFEASGVAHVPGTSGVLFVDDGRNREIFWMEVGADGSQKSPAVRVPLAADITDLEGITTDGASFYVVGSQSKSKGFEVERIQGLKAWLAAHVPELKGAAQVVGDTALNIEGLAWDPRGSRLLLGLRAPVVDGSALVIAIKFQDPRGAFSAGNLRIDGKTIRLPLGGAGVRSLEYDPDAKGFRVITGAGLNKEDREFRIVEWNGDTAPSSLPLIASFASSLKPEGITRATLNGRQVSVVVFDTGRFALLEPR